MLEKVINETTVRGECGSVEVQSKAAEKLFSQTNFLFLPDVEERDRRRAGEALAEGEAHFTVQRHRVQAGSAGPGGQLLTQQSQVRQAEGESQSQEQHQLGEEQQGQQHGGGESHPSHRGERGRQER